MKNKTKIKKYLMEQINKDNPVQIEKVERYLNLLDIFYKLDDDIKTHGTMVETKNASQSFVKPNPALAEKNKVNGSLLAIEKSFGLDKKKKQEETTPRRDLL
ncbi:P27 family phage terminase small subunit [Staphylococcus capitis]|uniref:P27 family phage terminase small subunit n=1 Tax=Staphylococcus capitis TaxID=29388 RepID=UPI003675D2D5